MQDRIKHKRYKSIVVSVVGWLLLAGFAFPALAAAGQSPIPAGCPGTTIQGPGTVDCSKIPAGCPGSTLAGGLSIPESDCPYAAPSSGTSDNPVTTGGTYKQPTTKTKNYCGGPEEEKRVYTAINFGCRHQGNALTDMVFAIIRWLSAGVGIVVVASLIIGGIQYSASGGDPQASQAAIKRIQSSVGALILFIFAYAILNYVLPGAFLK